VVRLFNLEDPRQYALMAEKQLRVQHKRVTKGFDNCSGPASSNAGSGSQVQCFGSGERGHTSYACPQRLMNLIDLEEEDVLPEPTYDNYDDEEEDVDRVMTAQRVEEEDCLPNMSSLW
jgi:hypothetical protein